MPPLFRAVCASLLLALALPVAPAAAQGGIGRNIEHITNVPVPSVDGKRPVNQGSDIEFARHRGRTYALAGAYDNGLQVLDVTRRERPVRMSVWDCRVAQGDVQVIQRERGRLYAAYTHDSGYAFRGGDCKTDLAAKGVEVGNGRGTFIVDLTDVERPKTVSFVPIPQGAHNTTVHPSGEYMYNSNSDLIMSPLPAIEIVDIRDLTRPRVVGELALKPFPGLGTESHDITFSRDGKRAYVAALSHAEILDTTNPAKPASVGTLLDPAINVWHQSDPVTLTDPVLGKRTFLLVEDEVAGAIGTGQCPNGGVHVYDITGDLERAPVKVGYWNIDDVRAADQGTNVYTCTAHVFRLHEKEALMTIAFYNGGVRVVDLSGLVGVALGRNGVGMKELGSFRFPDSDTWSVKAPTVSRKGFVMYGNDQSRGMDVYRYAPAKAPGARAGRGWMTPGEQRLAAAKLEAVNGKPALAALCLLDRRKGSERTELRQATQAAGLGLLK